jgi:NADH:ubiquinone oxidoreductase subunit E
LSLGKVTVWQMTEEQRQAYIQKYPIVPTEKPKEAKFSTETIDHVKTNERKKESLQKRKITRIIDSVDKEELHRLFMAGEKLEYIAKNLNISYANLNNYIKEQRKSNPDKWPYRAKK